MRILRKCIECECEAYTQEELSLFIPDKKQPHGRRNKCKACHNLEIKQARRDIKASWITYKGCACEDCGIIYDGTNECIFDFHPLDPKEKEFGLSFIIRHTPTKDVSKELDKCILLCSNCHRLKHAD